MVRTTWRAARVQQPWEIALDPHQSYFLESHCLLSTIPHALPLPCQFCLFPFPSLLSAGLSIPSGSAWFMGNPMIPTRLGPSPPRSPLAFPPLTSAHDLMAWLIPRAQHPSVNAGWSSRLTETDVESRTNITILDPPRALNPKPQFTPFPMPNPSSLGPINLKVLLLSIRIITKVAGGFTITKANAPYQHKYNSGCEQEIGTITLINALIGQQNQQLGSIDHFPTLATLALA